MIFMFPGNTHQVLSSPSITADTVVFLTRWLVMVIVGWLTACGVQSAPVVLRDTRGVEVRLEQPARRIIALTPHLTELVHAAGAWKQLVGVARFSNYPPEARQLPVVSDAGNFDFERILALKPDLVLAWRSGTPVGAVARLEQLGIPVFVSDAVRLADIGRSVEAIATLAGTLAESASARVEFDGRLQALWRRKPARDPVRVFYEIWPRPLMTVNGTHVISDVITLCGGVNVFGDSRPFTPEVSREAVIAARPEVVLGGGSADTAAGFAARWAAQPPPLNGIPAFYITPDLIQRPTPRLLEGAWRVCAHLDAVRH